MAPRKKRLKWLYANQVIVRTKNRPFGIERKSFCFKANKELLCQKSTLLISHSWQWPALVCKVFWTENAGITHWMPALEFKPKTKFIWLLGAICDLTARSNGMAANLSAKWQNSLKESWSNSILSVTFREPRLGRLSHRWKNKGTPSMERQNQQAITFPIRSVY